MPWHSFPLTDYQLLMMLLVFLYFSLLMSTLWPSWLVWSVAAVRMVSLSWPWCSSSLAWSEVLAFVTACLQVRPASKYYGYPWLPLVSGCPGNGGYKSGIVYSLAGGGASFMVGGLFEGCGFMGDRGARSRFASGIF